MDSNYILHLAQSSYCPYCNERVSLLYDKDGEQRPSFYICWNCEFVAELGKGEVTEQRMKSEGKIK